MKKKYYYLLLVIFITTAGAFASYKYLYKGHRDIQKERPSLVTDSSTLLEMFVSETTKDILNKTVEVNGIITGIEHQSIILDEKVQCSFTTELKEIKLNQKVTIKGRCIGYDDLFEIVKLDQCKLIK